MDIGLLSNLDGNLAYWIKSNELAIRTGKDSNGDPQITLYDTAENEPISHFGNPLQAKIEIRNMYEDELRQQ